MKVIWYGGTASSCVNISVFICVSDLIRLIVYLFRYCPILRPIFDKHNDLISLKEKERREHTQTNTFIYIYIYMADSEL